MTHTVPFGKHKGAPLAAVPTDYLHWFLRTCQLSRGLRDAVAAELAARGGPVPAPPPRQDRPQAPCHRCGAKELCHRWLEDRLGRRQIRRECARCGTFRGLAPQVPPYTLEADQRASPAADAAGTGER